MTASTSRALGVTTTYASDGQLPLTISSGGKTTEVLYGLSPVAEKTDEWNYVLSDGINVPRQLTDNSGLTTLTVRYNPWGKPIETSGTGNFDASFIDTLIDAATGLIYVGNGQYYDPETGHFLTRGVNPNSPNPYVPWNPITTFAGPLGLVVLLNKRKTQPLVIFAIIGLAVFTIGQACWACAPAPESVTNPSNTSNTQTQAPAATTVPSNTPAPTETPTQTVTPPPPCCNWLPIEFKITHYATIIESDPIFSYEAEKYVPTFDGTTTSLQKVPKWRFYVGNELSLTCDDNCKNWSVLVQGSGRLTEPDSLQLSNGKPYAKVDVYNKPFLQGYQFNAAYYFSDQNLGACQIRKDYSCSRHLSRSYSRIKPI